MNFGMKKEDPAIVVGDHLLVYLQECKMLSCIRAVETCSKFSRFQILLHSDSVLSLEPV